MKAILYYVNQLILITLLIYLAYLPTIRSDSFPWGDSKQDGLYLLIVPFGLLPAIIFFSILKYLILRQKDDLNDLKWTFLISIAVAVVDTFIVMLYPEGAIVIFILTLLFVSFLFVEIFLVRKELL